MIWEVFLGTRLGAVILALIRIVISPAKPKPFFVLDHQ